MNQEGTFNIEIVMILFVILIICSTMISLPIEEFGTGKNTQIRMQARDIASNVAQIVNTVYINGNGYSKRYTTPSEIGNQQYIVEINNKGVFVNSHNQVTYHQFIPKKIFNDKNIEKIVLTPDNTYQFTNKNETIEIEEE